MARSRTVLDLENLIRDLADCEPAAGTRHTSTMIRKHMNASWQAMRCMVTDAGDWTYVKVLDTTTGVGPDAGAAYGVLPLPVSAVRIHAIDITFTATDIRSLVNGSFNDRNEFHQRGSTYGRGIMTGTPSHFTVFNIGEESGASVTNGWIALVPAPDKVYPCRIYYLPAWTDITSDTYVFHGFEGWDDWVANDVVMKLAMKDNDMANTAQIASQMKAEAEKRMLASVRNAFQRVGPAVGRDTAQQLRRNRALRGAW